jgi:hypothetical protein
MAIQANLRKGDFMKSLIFSLFLIALFSGCGGGGGSGGNSATNPAVTSTGQFVDAEVAGAEYYSNSHSGITDLHGYFQYSVGEDVTFKVGQITLGKVRMDITDKLITPLDLASTTNKDDPKVINILRVVQSLDSDSNISNGIMIAQTKRDVLTLHKDLSSYNKELNTTELSALLQIQSSKIVSKTVAQQHFNQTLQNLTIYENNLKQKNGSSNENHSGNNNSEDNSQYSGSGSNSSSNTNTDTNTSTNTGTGTGQSTNTGAYTLLAWNDLGMHCMDGSDFSVFSILPPYNNLNAQLIKKVGTSNKHVTTGVTITYTAAASLNGKFNTTSMYDNNNNPKTNFWDYVGKLFNATPANDIGLTGNHTPTLTAKPLAYNAAHNWWEATGLPLTPYNDDGTKNYYPMVNVTAKDTSGNILATTKVVLPISDEMDCKVCHGSTSGYTQAKPSAGWENDPNAEKDFKYNILRLHDQKFPTAVSDNQSALQAKGYTGYSNTGLYASAKNGNPTLCATCHASNALPGTGIAGIKPLTEAIHSLHANANDPVAGIKLGASTNRSACYRCHPGATTQCLRGAMGKQSNIQCQSCHGDMNAVGKHGRVGWMDEPNCQACHQNGQRYLKAVTNTSTGALRASLDNRFATNSNTPQAGVSMYRFSTGHGHMQCEACHGSTHAIYPSSHKVDNLQSIAVQGHEGTIAECIACHSTMPSTTTGGPHGMHTVGQAWVENHKHVAEQNPTQCSACHGSNYRGSVLSKTFSTRVLSIEHGTKTLPQGHQVSCYDCHNGPNGG